MYFLEDFNRFTWVFPLKTKAEVKSVFIRFHHLVERQFGLKLKCLQSDQGGEYKTLFSYLTDQGIHIRHSCAYVHQQNGKSERKHRHIVETCLTMLATASMPLNYWWLAFEIATFLINRMPITIIKYMNPYQKLFGFLPCYTVLKVFSCACFTFLRMYNKNKFDFHYSKCVFVGLVSFINDTNVLDKMARLLLLLVSNSMNMIFLLKLVVFLLILI